MCTRNERVMKESCFSLKKKNICQPSKWTKYGSKNFIFAICKCSNIAL